MTVQTNHAHAMQKYTQKTKTNKSMYTESDFLNIIRRYTLCHTTTLHISPPIASVSINQHESVALCHVPFHLAPRVILVHRLNVL